MTAPRRLLPADALWMAAHHTGGRSLLQPEVLGVGLAAALIGELVLDGWLTVEPQNAAQAAQLCLRAPASCGHLAPNIRCPVCPNLSWQPDDVATAPVLLGLRERVWALQRERRDRFIVPTQDLQTWIRYMQEPPDAQYLNQPVTALVEQRLAKAGLAREIERGLLKRKRVWEPTDSAVAGGATAVIGSRYRDGSSLSPDELLLTAMIAAVGLDAKVFDLLRPAERDDLKKRAFLGVPESLQALLLTTESIHHKQVLMR
jgi:hypothetical protein